MKTVRIGTRGSALALAQARLLLEFLCERGISSEIVPIRTTGDRIQDRTLAEIGGKGLFVRELDQALRAGLCDVAVHSCKDLPMELPADLPVLGCSARENPRDVLVLPAGRTAWDRARPVGTCSPRRSVQLKRYSPGIAIEPVRGNVESRLRKLDGGAFGALVLAAAGLRRLGLAARISRYFSAEEMTPAPGQGALCVQGRAGEDYGYLSDFFDRAVMAAVRAERAFAAAIGGGCASPAGAFAQVCEGELHLLAFAADADGGFRRRALCGAADAPERLGEALARRFQEGGAAE